MKKLNYIVLLPLTFAFCGHVLADDNHNGFALGLQAGYGFSESKVHRKTTRLARFGMNEKNDSSNISGRGIIAGSLIEMNHFIKDSILLSVQFNALYTTIKGKIKTDILPPQGLQTSLRKKYSYGAAIRLGKTFDRTLPYLKVGVINSKWSSTTDALPRFGIGKKTRNSVGFEGGIGVDFHINDHMSVGSEFSHIEYRRFTYSMFRNSNDKVANISVKPRENRIMLHLKLNLTNLFAVKK